MAKDKYKIRVSNRTYYSLIDDMYTFDFYKPNGDMNKNKFYYTVINGYYGVYTKRSSEIASILYQELNNNDKNYITKLSIKINDRLWESKNSDRLSYYHPCDIYIQTTKESARWFESWNYTSNQLWKNIKEKKKKERMNHSVIHTNIRKELLETNLVS